MIAPLSAANEVAELRAAADVLKSGGHFDRAVGRLLDRIANDWSDTLRRPAWSDEALSLAALVNVRSER